jgi:mannitol-1-phosphate 5-dehydrogenase
MSGVIQEPDGIAAQGLAPITNSFPRAFLVEEFNRILVTKITLPGFHRSIDVFEEKPDLLPFEEAKLYGHNAVHAMLGFLAHRKGYRCMSEIANDHPLFELGREAFLLESGPALLERYRGLDNLFTEHGFQNYAEDLLSRMLNPYLRDRVERIIRDPRRKLGWDDRFIGAMRLALDAGVTPTRFALGAAAALESLGDSRNPREQLQTLWPAPDMPPGRKAQLQGLISQAADSLRNFGR